jgi:glycine cleavage system aminomethyltransferase T
VPLGITQVRASRITYVGELGWELYVPIESTLLVCVQCVALSVVCGV